MSTRRHLLQAVAFLLGLSCVPLASALCNKPRHRWGLDLVDISCLDAQDQVVDRDCDHERYASEWGAATLTGALQDETQGEHPGPTNLELRHWSMTWSKQP